MTDAVNDTARNLNKVLLRKNAIVEAKKWIKSDIDNILKDFNQLDPYVQSCLIQCVIGLSTEEFDKISDKYFQIINIALGSHEEWVKRVANEFAHYPKIHVDDDINERFDISALSIITGEQISSTSTSNESETTDLSSQEIEPLDFDLKPPSLSMKPPRLSHKKQQQSGHTVQRVSSSNLSIPSNPRPQQVPSGIAIPRPPPPQNFPPPKKEKKKIQFDDLPTLPPETKKKKKIQREFPM
ncbi:hypothetical protein TRFO_20343 [Tritrichomonas foetus]|uniref:Uncharacterized protein n=1 Tax=Tritrichomonas foetus TaxID=1144522 RepID=A0A1J4KGP3_9EUKA|nr:hypothetical protein TRFO_20343 [Tritrichomonas foetus]|eukprot:OHT10387.1 hypothetical protein TRFO_20343 [Tritrichomonas foetus]